jgi:altronate dehydratase
MIKRRSREVNSALPPRAIIGSQRLEKANQVARPFHLVHTGRDRPGQRKEGKVSRLIRLSEQDNVAVAARSIAQGDALEVDGLRLAARDAIPFAHKIALRPIAADAQVIKYGVPIGRAKVAIEPGSHVHVHNIRSDYVNNEVDFFEEAEGAA